RARRPRSGWLFGQPRTTFRPVRTMSAGHGLQVHPFKGLWTGCRFTARMWIVVGDTTDSGGRVITGSAFTSVDGRPVARVTDQAVCPKHKGVFPVVDGDATTIIDGQPVALHGSSLACGCKVLAVQQTRAFVDPGSAAGAAAKTGPASFATLSSPSPSGTGLSPGLVNASVLDDYTLYYHYDDLDKTPVRGVSYQATLAD